MFGAVLPTTASLGLPYVGFYCCYELFVHPLDMRPFDPQSIFMFSSVCAAVASLPALLLCTLVVVRAKPALRIDAFRLGLIVALCVVLASGLLVNHYAVEISSLWLC